MPSNYVQVRLGERLYTYFCPQGADVGDKVILPPNIFTPYEQSARVVELGRGTKRPLKDCRLADA